MKWIPFISKQQIVGRKVNEHTSDVLYYRWKQTDEEHVKQHDHELWPKSVRLWLTYLLNYILSHFVIQDS